MFKIIAILAVAALATAAPIPEAKPQADGWNTWGPGWNTWTGWGPGWNTWGPGWNVPTPTPVPAPTTLPGSGWN